MAINLSKTGYIVTDATLAALAREYVSGIEQVDNVRGNYLRILVAHSQRDITRSGGKRASRIQCEGAVNAAHDHLYAVIMEAVTTQDIAHSDDLPDDERMRRSLERNRRSNFARTAKSTLLAWIAAGGKLMSLRPADVTKEGLRKLYARRSPEAPLSERMERIARSLERRVKELAEEDMDEAREFVDELQTRLALLVARPLARKTVRRGDMTLHPQ